MYHYDWKSLLRWFITVLIAIWESVLADFSTGLDRAVRRLKGLLPGCQKISQGLWQAWERVQHTLRDIELYKPLRPIGNPRIQDRFVKGLLTKNPHGSCQWGEWGLRGYGFQGLWFRVYSRLQYSGPQNQTVERKSKYVVPNSFKFSHWLSTSNLRLDLGTRIRDPMDAQLGLYSLQILA